MSNLPQETQQAIASKAAAYADQQHAHEGDDIHVGYLAGATSWAGKAKELADAMQKVSNIISWMDDERFKPMLSEIVDAALAKYKEVRNE